MVWQFRPPFEMRLAAIISSKGRKIYKQKCFHKRTRLVVTRKSYRICFGKVRVTQETNHYQKKTEEKSVTLLTNS